MIRMEDCLTHNKGVDEMAKTLLLMRHAKSSWKDEKLTDFDRPLKKRGVEAAKMIGEVIVMTELVPQVILSSPAKRAKQTAEIVAEETGFKGELTYVDSFYMGDPADFIAGLSELPDEVERVLVIGHNPGMEALLQMLDGQVGLMPPGSMAHLALSLKHWADFTPATVGELISFWEPGKIEFGDPEEKMGKDKEKKDKDKKGKKKDKKDKKKDKK